MTRASPAGPTTMATGEVTVQAIDMAMEELTGNKYEGVNFIVADYESGWAVHGGDDPHVVELMDGLNIISSYDLNDLRDERQKLARRLLTL